MAQLRVRNTRITSRVRAAGREEVGRLLAIEGVRCAELTRLRDASPRYGRDWDWMLELHLTAGTDAHQCVDHHGACREWLGDLRLLGMRPSVLVADGAPFCVEKITEEHHPRHLVRPIAMSNGECSPFSLA